MVDGALGDDEPLGNLAVAQTLGDERQHLELASGQPGRVRAGPCPRAARDRARADGAQPRGARSSPPVQPRERAARRAPCAAHPRRRRAARRRLRRGSRSHASVRSPPASRRRSRGGTAPRRRSARSARRPPASASSSAPPRTKCPSALGPAEMGLRRPRRPRVPSSHGRLRPRDRDGGDPLQLVTRLGEAAALRRAGPMRPDRRAALARVRGRRARGFARTAHGSARQICASCAASDQAPCARRTLDRQLSR